MDSKQFIDAYRGLNSNYLRLLESLSSLRALSAIPVQQCSDRELLQQALTVLADNQDLECCSIFLLQREHLFNIARVGCGAMGASLSYNEGTSATISFALGEGIVGQAAMSAELQHCSDCRSDPDLFPYGVVPAELGGSAAGSVICVPIRRGSEVLGVLSVSHPQTGFFDQSYERSLRLYCDVLGQLLSNNRLLHHMDDLVHQRTEELQRALDDAEQLRRKYEELAVVDDLTQLHNRRFFFPEARAELARALRHEIPFSLLLLDIDHFKAVNDHHGHKVGDEVLQKVAQSLISLVREGDILARFGGEEFVLALPNTDSQGAMLLAERIRVEVKGLHWKSGLRDLSVSVSIGISTMSDYGAQDTQKCLEQLISNADQALYFGKQHGRDQSCNYDEIACKL